MIGEELTTFLVRWVDQIINTEGGEGIIIIKSHQNAPAPPFPYVAINYIGNLNKIGRSAARTIDDDGNRLLVNDYTHAVEIREVGGSGERLAKIIDSIERQDIQILFDENGVSYLTEGDILRVPRLEYNDWIRESLVEIQLMTATAITEASSWIETIEYTGEIGGLTNE